MTLPIQDPASLKNLHDVVAPAPESMWPPATGWYVLAALILVTAVLVTIQLIMRWWRNRYRKAGLFELTQLRKSSSDPSQTVAGIDRILKRVALVAWPRKEVAGLSGDSWITFLNQTAPSKLFDVEQARKLHHVVYSSKLRSNVSDEQLDWLFEKAEIWIKKHQIPPTLGEQEQSL